jgi:hypothetical protein
MVVRALCRYSLDFDSDGFLSSAVGAFGMLMALSALPLPSQVDEA